MTLTRPKYVYDAKDKSIWTTEDEHIAIVFKHEQGRRIVHVLNEIQTLFEAVDHFRECPLQEQMRQYCQVCLKTLELLEQRNHG